MEYALRPNINMVNDEFVYVSILVLMEYALRLVFRGDADIILLSLNPCFNGICSATNSVVFRGDADIIVSILVLMEYALRLKFSHYVRKRKTVSILVLMEYALRPC